MTNKAYDKQTTLKMEKEIILMMMEKQAIQPKTKRQIDERLAVMKLSAMRAISQEYYLLPYRNYEQYSEEERSSRRWADAVGIVHKRISRQPKLEWPPKLLNNDVIERG